MPLLIMAKHMSSELVLFDWALLHQIIVLNIFLNLYKLV